MSKSTKILIIISTIIAIGAIAAVAVALINKGDTENTNTPASHTHESSSAHQDDNSPVAATITYKNTGFEPAATTIKAGESVKVINDSNAPLDFGSDPHPSHTDNPELNAGDIEHGESKTFTVTTKGDWGYHNHYNPSNHGTIKVE